MGGVEIVEQLRQDPFPVWLLSVSPDAHSLHCPDALLELFLGLDHMLLGCLYRGVDANRLGHVLTSGVDVEPQDSPIYAADYSKAWEYGGWPKVLLAFDRSQLQRTFREVPSDISDLELAELQTIYPTRLDSKDGSKIWLSRLSADDRRIATYEASYAYWIPGIPLEALRALFIVGRPHDADTVESLAALVRAS